MAAMDAIRWFNPSQPDTLRNAVMLGYAEAFFTLLSLGVLASASGIPTPIMFLAVVGAVAGAAGCASEKKWGYGLALASASVIVLAHLIYVIRIGSISLALIGLMFAGAWLYLLTHERTRAYQRVWFS